MSARRKDQPTVTVPAPPTPPDPVPHEPGAATEFPHWCRPQHAEAVLALHRLADHFEYLRDKATDEQCTTPLYSGVDVWEKAHEMTRRTATDVARGWFPQTLTSAPIDQAQVDITSGGYEPIPPDVDLQQLIGRAVQLTLADGTVTTGTLVFDLAELPREAGPDTMFDYAMVRRTTVVRRDQIVDARINWDAKP